MWDIGKITVLLQEELRKHGRKDEVQQCSEIPEGKAEQRWEGIFSSVSATVHERVPQAVASLTLWQMVVEQVIRQYGVDMHDLLIQGSWLQVEMCRLMLMKIYTECLTRDVGNREDHENATGRTLKTGSKERGLAVSGDIRRKDPKTMGDSESDGKDGIDPIEEPIYEYHDSRHCAVAGALGHSRHHRAEAHTVVPLKTFEVASTRVHVHKGDITKMNVDVIVNAANGHLAHGSGVAGAIARAAGPDFTQECYRIIQERGEIYHGDGVMTSAGRLPCLAVYHVVGPMWDYFANKNDCLDILHQAFTSCLMASKDYSSIAIPAVSSGIYGVPSELVAQTMCEAVTKFCHGEAHQSRLRVIHLVDINTVMVKLLQENFELQSGTSEENSQKSARMASILSGVTGVAGCTWKGLGSTTKESVLDEGPFESGSHEPPVERSENDRKYNRSSSSLSDTGIKTDSAVMSRRDSASGEGSGVLRSHESHEERTEDNRKYKRSSSSLSDTDNKMGNVVMPGRKFASGEGSNDSPGKRPDDDGKHRSSSTSSLSDTDNKKGDVKSASMALPSSGDPDKLRPSTYVGRSPDERENKNGDDVGKTPIAKDHGRESYSAVAQGSTTSITEKRAPDIGGVAGKQGGAAAASEGDGSDGGDPCPIRLEMADKPKILPNCKHKFNTCFDQKRECSVCYTVYGMLHGNQPKSGTMYSTISSTALPGYTCQTIVIEYSFTDGTQTREHPHPGQPFHGTERTAYLPDNQDGRKILGFLKRAFSQRLTFTVGRSVTTGLDNVVTWNDILHKTNRNGGPDGYGYPDEGYLQRVTEDLAAKGIN
ncbi:hypothetical protein LSAT2_008619 [Lamellibrachia satsuma]|nr:hypothetical protein LSAT2_008619 [Lamellibrachia satsuma]